jgi:hypothetical protein
MFKRLDAKRKADQRAEALRWRGLSAEEKWAEMAAAARRWCGLNRQTERDAAVAAVIVADNCGEGPQ